VQALHSLTAKWRNHLAATAELLPELLAQERPVLNSAEAMRDNITADALQAVYPYATPERIRATLESFVRKGLLDDLTQGIYRFSPRMHRYLHDTQLALAASAEAIITIPSDQTNRLAVLTVALIDKLQKGPNAISTPIFNLSCTNIAPSEHPLVQVQQRLICLMSYHDDAHMAAWRAEEYGPVGIRVASHMHTLGEAVTMESFLKAPLFYDEVYVNIGLDELRQRGDLLDTGVGFALTAKGVVRRERVDTLTDEMFSIPFEQRLTDFGRKDWVMLITTLIEATRTTKSLVG
jgi:hypothetical protein